MEHRARQLIGDAATWLAAATPTTLRSSSPDDNLDQLLNRFSTACGLHDDDDDGRRLLMRAPT